MARCGGQSSFPYRNRPLLRSRRKALDEIQYFPYTFRVKFARRLPKKFLTATHPDRL
jgi:hypothetical protein